MTKIDLPKIANRIRTFLPEILVILLCLVIQSVIISQKEGYHEDELLSFEMANASYTPWVTPTQPEGRMGKFVRQEIKGDNLIDTLGNIRFIIGDTISNKGESILLSYTADVYDEPVWFDDTVFENYLTVEKGTAFEFTSAYWNIKDDNHPPVHAILLHLVSSIFRGKINPWIGCGLNLIFMVGILICLEDLGRLIAPKLALDENTGRLAGLFAALMYGMSWGAMSTVLLIRMYCIMTFFIALSFDINLRILFDTKEKKRSGAIITATVLGFLTQYFFLFYAIPMAAAAVIILLRDKRCKEALIYIRNMAIAAVIGLVTFPFAIGDVFSSSRGVEAIDNLSKGFSGYGERIIAFAQILGKRTFGSVWVLMAILVIYIAVTIAVNKKESIKIISVTCLPFLVYVLLASRMSPYLVDRYIMGVFPVFVLLGCTGICGMLEKTFDKPFPKYILCSALIAVQFVGLFFYDGEYLYKGYNTVLAKASEYEALPCICVYEGNCYENLLEFTYFDKTLMVTVEELEDREDRESIEELDSAVIIIKPSADYEKTMEILEGYGIDESECEVIMTDENKGDVYLVYGEADRA